MDRGCRVPTGSTSSKVAEFLRLRTRLEQPFRVGFEDGLMDVSVREEDDLLWYVEVKAKPSMLAPLLRDLEVYSSGVDIQAPDRGNDPLRKSKYLVRHRPPLISLVGGEERWHFAVQYPATASFALIRRDDPLDELSAAEALD